MTSTLHVWLGDEAAIEEADDDFYTLLDTLEVEENADLPGAFQFTLPIATALDGTDEDLTIVDDERFRPYRRVAVVVSVEGFGDACIFDGYVLAHTIQLDSGTTGSTAQVWGQDVSCLMNLVERTKVRPGTDGTTANAIFDHYNFTPADDNLVDDGPDRQLDGPVLMQRGTDLQFLRERARRTGRLLRVSCGDTPGDNMGYFIKPNLAAEPVATLTLNPVQDANVASLKFSWDVIRPTEALAQALVTAKDAVEGGAKESGLSLLDERSLSDFVDDAERVTQVRVSATVDDAGELRTRSESLLREAGWFVRCEGEADLEDLQPVLRAGMIVKIDGAGTLHSGKYFVWNVRHTISADSHRMRFVLVRNAVGPQ